MEYKFSNRALSAKPSRIREISARGAIDPEFISFAIGNPAYETFPVEEIRRCNDLIYERCPKYALQPPAIPSAVSPDEHNLEIQHHLLSEQFRFYCGEK